jgi:ribosomal protein S13
LRSVFESTDSTATYLYVVKALENVPGIGKVRARAILAEVGVG